MNNLSHYAAGVLPILAIVGVLAVLFALSCAGTWLAMSTPAQRRGVVTRAMLFGESVVRSLVWRPLMRLPFRNRLTLRLTVWSARLLDALDVSHHHLLAQSAGRWCYDCLDYADRFLPHEALGVLECDECDHDCERIAAEIHESVRPAVLAWLDSEKNARPNLTVA